MAQELYELPQGWEWKTLSSFATVIMGQSPPSSTYNRDKIGLPLINGPVEFSKDPFGETVKIQYTTAPNKICKKGDLLLCVRGATTGRTNIAGFDACIGRGVAAIRHPHQRYLAWLIRAQAQIILQKGKGSTFPAITGAELKKLQIPVPPLAEQERIVAKLDALFSRIDQAIAQLQHTQAQTKALFASALDAAFESEKHQYKTLKEISNLVTDGTHHSPKIQHPEAGPERFKYLTSKNVKFHGLKLDNLTYIDKDVHEEIYNRCPPEYLDQLITKDGAMTGTCCLNTLDEPYSLLSSVALVKLKREMMEPHFLNYFLRSPKGQNSMLEDIAGAAIKRTTLTKLKVLKIPVPPLAEQSKIVAQLDAISERTQALTAATSAQLEQLQSLKASLLDAAFRGQLPSDQ